MNRNYITLLSGFLMLIGVFSCKDEANIPVPPDIHTIVLNNHSLNLSVEDEAVIKPSFNSVSTYRKGFKWETSSPDVVSFQVDSITFDCHVLALQLGQTTMRLVSEDGTVSDTCLVVVDREPFILKHPLLINFGPNVPGEAVWNYQLNYQKGSSLFDMFDAEKNDTPVDFQILKSFSWYEDDVNLHDSYQLSSEYGSLFIPNEVAKTAFKGDTKDTEVEIELSSLRIKQKYNIGFLSCKPTWDDVCSTRFTVEGDNSQTCTILTKLSASNAGETGAIVPTGTTLPNGTPVEQNTTIRVGMLKNVSPDTNGSIKLKISSGEGGNQPSGVFWVSCLWIWPADVPSEGVY